MMERRFEIKKKDILFVLLFLSFFQPRGWQNIPALSGIFFYYSIIVSIFLVFFVKWKIIKDPFLVSIWIYYAVYMIASIVNGENVKYVFVKVIYILIFFSFFDYSLNKDFFYIIKIMACISKGYIIINFVSALIFPSGFGERIMDSDIRGYYFLGERNSILYALIPMIAIIIVNEYSKKDTLNAKAIFYYILVLLSVIISGSSTGIFVTIALGIMFLYVLYGGSFNFKILLVIYAILWIFIVLFQYTNIVAEYVAPLFGKTGSRAITFSQRTTLWYSALELVKQKPLLGYGGWLENHIVFFKNVNLYSAHNAILQLLLDAGICGLVSIIGCCWTNLFFLKKMSFSRKRQIIISAIFCYLVYLLMEACEFRYFLMFMMLLKLLPEEKEQVFTE